MLFAMAARFGADRADSLVCCLRPSRLLNQPFPIAAARHCIVVAEEMEKHFDLGNLDECLGGALPDGKLWSYEGYEKRMQALDAAAAAAVEQAGKESAVLSAEDQALNAEFEKHVVVI